MTQTTPITVLQLKKLCEEEIKKGNGDKVIMISDDDEGNGFHYLWFDFTPIDDFEEYVNEKVAPKNKTIILG